LKLPRREFFLSRRRRLTHGCANVLPWNNVFCNEAEEYLLSGWCPFPARLASSLLFGHVDLFSRPVSVVRMPRRHHRKNQKIPEPLIRLFDWILREDNLAYGGRSETRPRVATSVVAIGGTLDFRESGDPRIGNRDMICSDPQALRKCKICSPWRLFWRIEKSNAVGVGKVSILISSRGRRILSFGSPSACAHY
jgi:hypothetical protein